MTSNKFFKKHKIITFLLCASFLLNIFLIYDKYSKTDNKSETIKEDSHRNKNLRGNPRTNNRRVIQRR